MGQNAMTFDEADLHAFADGRLEPRRAALLAESLASDPQGRQRMDAWKRQNDGLRTLFASVLFEPIPVRLLPARLPGERIPAPRSSPAPIGEEVPRRTGALALMGLGLLLVGFAAALLTDAATDLFGRGSRVAAPPEVRLVASPAPLASRVSDLYAALLADPLRAPDLTSSDKGRLARWMALHLGETARLPDLRNLGWSLVTARTEPGPAIVLLYGNGARRLGLYVARRAVGGDGTETASETGTASAVSTWADGPLAYGLAAARGDRDDLDLVVSAIRRSTGLDPQP